MPRRLRYQVAVSLDGYIARLDGSHDWIVMDPTIDFAALFGGFDAAVMGRKTYDVVRAQGHLEMMSGIECVVFSRSLPESTAPGLRVTHDDPVNTTRAMKAQAGRDIWLYGGGELFLTLLQAGLVDTVELAVIPVLLGDGVPLVPPGHETTLTLCDSRVLLASGIVALAYAVPGGVGPAPVIDWVAPGA